MASTKECRKCQQTKAVEEFRPVYDKRSDKRYPCAWCKECERVRALERYRANRDTCIEQNRTYKQEHKEEIREKRKEYLKNTQEWVKIRYRQYCDNNREKINSIARAYRETNPQVKIKSALSTRIRELIKKELPTSSYLGAPMSVILDWFSFNFNDAMTRQNHGLYWHIDHTIPVKSFNLDDDKEYNLCFSWMNLMPLERIQNIRKSNKLMIPRIWHQEAQLRRFAKEHPELKPDIDNFIESYSKKLKTLLCGAT